MFLPWIFTVEQRNASWNWPTGIVCERGTGCAALQPISMIGQRCEGAECARPQGPIERSLGGWPCGMDHGSPVSADHFTIP